jgi:hypothetical protein
MYSESDVPILWSLAVVSFAMGRLLGGVAIKWGPGPARERAKKFLVLGAGVGLSVAFTGMAVDVRGLCAARLLAGLFSAGLWTRKQQQQEVRKAAGEGQEGGPTVSPLWCLGVCLGEMEPRPPGQLAHLQSPSDGGSDPSVARPQAA